IDARNKLLQLALVLLVALFEIEVVAVRANVIEDLGDPRVDRGVAGVDMAQEPRRDVHGPLEIGRVRLMRQGRRSQRRCPRSSRLVDCSACGMRSSQTPSPPSPRWRPGRPRGCGARPGLASSGAWGTR